MLTARIGTADLVSTLDGLREQLGDAWIPGWDGVTNSEAEAIIDELRRRGTGQAQEALIDHGIE